MSDTAEKFVIVVVLSARSQRLGKRCAPYERKKWAGDEESECHAKLTWTVVWQRRQVSYLDQRLSALAHGLRNAREIAFSPIALFGFI
jgi:hypothetical protein